MPFNHYARELCARSDKWNTKRMHLLTPSIVKTNLEKSRNISHETSEIFQRIINHIDLIQLKLSYSYSWNVRNYIVDHINNRSELERIRFDVEHWLDLWIRRSRCAKNRARILRERSADRWSRARYRRAKDRRSGREEGRKLYHTASLGSLLYVTRIRNEETNDRPNESARMPRFPFHSSFPLPAPYLSFAPRPRHHSFSSSRAVKRTLRSERDRFLPLTRESAVGSREKDFREKFPCICIWRICGASSFFNLFDWNFEKN